MDFFLRPWLLSKFRLLLSKRAVGCLTAPQPLDLQKKLKVLLNADNLRKIMSPHPALYLYAELYAIMLAWTQSEGPTKVDKNLTAPTIIVRTE